MISDGLKLLVAGMGIVFAFLGFMIIIISLFKHLLKPFAHIMEEETSKPVQKKSVAKKKSSPDDKSVITAITAAVRKYRSEHDNKEDNNKK